MLFVTTAPRTVAWAGPTAPTAPTVAMAVRA